MLAEGAQQKLETLPHSPGVYVFRGDNDAVLYVGKARSLRSRVRSYFQPGSSDIRAFVSRLESELRDIETFVTHTEKEAALLENQLIKAHQPKYNIKLRDDKEFLSLRLDPKKKWPRLEVVRRPKQDGALYFGPYHSATAARQTLRLVNRYFQLRTCTDSEFRLRTRPCLQYQIKRCPGPCVLDVDHDTYNAQVKNVARFLDGRHDELVRDLESRMQRASDAEHYEHAAVFRDQLRAVERVQEEQRVAGAKDANHDAIGFFRQGDQAEVAVLSIRNGRLFGVRTADLKRVAVPNDEMLGAFVAETYGAGVQTPREILVPTELEAMDGLSEMLSDAQGYKVTVKVAQRGDKKKLLDLATENAEHAFFEKRRAREDIEQRLAQVQRLLRLSGPPRVIECVDISHTGGDETVGVFVSLRDGQPDRSRYRSFRVKTTGGGDDYGAMYEVITRRLRRGREDDEAWALPDLLLVDGGKGQLGVATQARKDTGVKIELASIAKPRQTVDGDALEDRIFRPDQKNPIAIRGNPALSLLMFARDEAHRASNELRKKVGKRQRLRSELDDVPGIGAKTRNKLLRAFGSIKAVFEADESELRAAGATKKQAEAILSVAPQHVPPSPTDDPEPDTRAPSSDEGRLAEDAAVENAFVRDE